ncbi:kinase-like domain-containing protein [Ephemerocybe angulata]|uniref:Kinase-like domain-containing protein n=1 Tax=Ephemerocybe angulata TaxID=980116 RepID=A0A8H6HM17_9AGAR|nr:kinase-like domain-containing protein [Tulosesus angulatus]
MALKHICSSSSCGQAFDIWTQLKPIYSYSGLLRVATQVADIFLLIALDRAASKALCRLVGPHAQVILDTLQMILDTGHTLSNEDSCRKHLQIRYLLLGLAKRSCQYPKCLVLSAITREGDHAVTAGHFGEIWKGRFQGDSVCVKVVKVYARSDVDKLLKAFTREAILWSHLSHENVLPFYGIHRLDDIAGRMCLISPWMENGNIGEYLLRNPKAKRLVLASDVCSGLAYLHAQDIVHGDLKGANILVTRTERACVADFGLSIIAENEIMRWTSTASAATLGGTVRWQAPELFNPEAEDTKSSKMSDVYALGCVFYEIFTGKVPFYEVPREATVISYILLGRAPTKPAPGSEPFSQWGLSDAIWTTCIERCWERLPEDRPRPSDILESSAFNEGSSSLAESAITGDFLQEGWMTPAEVRNSVRRREFGFGWSFLPPLNPPQMRPSIGEENTRKAKKIRLNKEGEDKIQPLHARSHLEYLEAVKNVFQDQPEVYSEFLDIMKNFKGGVCVPSSVFSPQDIWLILPSQ